MHSNRLCIVTEQAIHNFLALVHGLDDGGRGEQCLRRINNQLEVGIAYHVKEVVERGPLHEVVPQLVLKNNKTTIF